MDTPKPIVIRTPHTFLHNRLVQHGRTETWKVIKVEGSIELITDIPGLLRYLSQKVEFNSTRQSRLLSGLIQARAVGIKGIQTRRATMNGKESLRNFLDPDEIEARVAEQRTDWTPAQRLAYPPRQHLLDEERRSRALIEFLVGMSQDCCNCTDPFTDKVQRFLDLDEEAQ